MIKFERYYGLNFKYQLLMGNNNKKKEKSFRFLLLRLIEREIISSK